MSPEQAEIWRERVRRVCIRSLPRSLRHLEEDVRAEMLCDVLAVHRRAGRDDTAVNMDFALWNAVHRLDGEARYRQTESSQLTRTGNLPQRPAPAKPLADEWAIAAARLDRMWPRLTDRQRQVVADIGAGRHPSESDVPRSTFGNVRSAVRRHLDMARSAQPGGGS